MASATTSTQDNLRSINCTQCAAPLTLHGGHKVQTITCSYCGSSLDTKDEYKILTQFTNRDRPPTPFELGMTGKLNDVEFTIIGMIQWRSDDGYGWLEFSLYSPTHGYAWLEQVDNHYLFSRRVRDLPNTRMSADVRSTFRVRDRSYKVFESYRAKILYVEGELTFVAKAGDRVDVIEGISPPYVFSLERTEQEEEYVLGEYIEPQEVFDAFGIRNEPGRRYKVHPGQPYNPSGITAGLGGAGKIFGPISIVLLILTVFFGSGKEIAKAQFDAKVFKNGSQTQPFKVESADKLMALEMHAPLRNSWAAFDIQVNQGEKNIFSMAKQISYYSGVDGGESWSEGSQNAKAYFKLPSPGQYHLVVRGEGGSGNRSRGVPRGGNLQVKIKEGVIVTRYYWILLGLCAAAFAWPFIARWRFESRRWSEADTDDDDD